MKKFTLYRVIGSPFSMKVELAIKYKKIEDLVYMFDIDNGISPISPRESVGSINPLGKIPALKTNDGLEIFDSNLIVEYLDDEFKETSLKVEIHDSLEQKKLQVVSEGLMDSVVNYRYEVAYRSKDGEENEWLKAHITKINNTLSYLEDNYKFIPNNINISSISIFSAIRYLEYRMSDIDIKEKYPNLYGWYKLSKINLL